MSKRLALVAILIFAATLFAQDYAFLKDPESNDISNNFAVKGRRDKSFSLKFISPDDTSYFVFWGSGRDTIPIVRDSSSIARIAIEPKALPLGEHHIEVLSKFKKEVLDFTIKIEESPLVYMVILEMLFGLVLFMLGLKFSSKGISRLSGYRLKEILWNLTGSNLKGFLSGIVLTLMMQSSTLFSVMVISFVSDGLISIAGAVYMFAGSAIGTSLIVQLIAFDISFFSLIMIIVGFYIDEKSKKMKYIGMSIMGFGFIFFAIQLMANTMLPLENTKIFSEAIRIMNQNLPLLFVVTAFFTFLVHSSAVIVALVIGLYMSGILDYRAIIVMVAASNLGTSFTSAFAGIKGDEKARYLTSINISSRIVASGIFIFFMIKYQPILSEEILSARGIANSHLMYNLLFAVIIIVMLPLISYFSRFLKKSKISSDGERMLRENIVQNPAVALSKGLRDIISMLELAGNMIDKSFIALKTNDSVLSNETIMEDNAIDEYEKNVTMFLVSIYKEEASEQVSKKTQDMLYIADEIEHIGDVVSKNIMTSVKKRMDNNYYFSEEGFRDLKMFHSEVMKTYEMTLSALTLYDEKTANEVLKRRDYMLSLLSDLHNNHLKRLKDGMKESIETSTLHLDLLNDYERINFHLYKIAYHIVKK
ncbi:MAG: Na/Pi cotransporter family protein [bacterium]|nr:Na/Pi cotransporter family protein [bacterium]